MVRQVVFRQTIISLALVITGITIGWLTGLSVTPVVATLTASITGAAAAIIAALSETHGEAEDIARASKSKLAQLKLNFIPLSMLAFGILIGSIFGVRARNYHWLGSDVSSEVAKWTNLGVSPDIVLDRLLAAHYPDASFNKAYSETVVSEITLWTEFGLTKEDVAQRIFDQRYPMNGGQSSLVPNNQPNVQVGSYLFAVGSTECASLLAATKRAKASSDEQLIIRAFEGSTQPALRRLAGVVNDSQLLEELVEQVLCTEN